MLRLICGAAKLSSQLTVKNAHLPGNSLFPINRGLSLFQNFTKPLLGNQQNVQTIDTRNVTKFSWGKGKRKTVKVVLNKFYRLHWGGWIRTMCGRSRKLWSKSPKRLRRLRQHMLCNANQSMLLDKMVGPYWRKPRYYVDDPYEPYHTREEYKFTYTKPKPFYPPEH